MKYETNTFTAPCSGLQGAVAQYAAYCNGLQGAVAQYAANQTRNTGMSPFVLKISALGYFRCITQHMSPAAFRPVRKTQQ